MNINFLYNLIFNNQGSKPNSETAISVDPSLDIAIEEVCSKLKFSSNADIAIVYISSTFASDYPRLLPLLKRKLNAKILIGSGVGGVIGLENHDLLKEHLNIPSLSITLLKLPGAGLVPFHIPEDANIDLDNPGKVWKDYIKNINISMNFCSAIMFIEPSMKKINELISSFDFSFPNSNLIGGIAAYHPFSYGSLFFEDKLCKGAIGFLMNGEWKIETLVTRGVKPLGPILEVHSAQKNILYKVKENDKLVTPLQFLQQLIGDLSLNERDLIQQSLFLGVENKNMKISSDGKLLTDGTFVVRDLLGLDPSNGAVAVTDLLKVGQKIQFHSRDIQISQKEIEIGIQNLLLQTGEKPILTLLLSCIGRSQSDAGNYYDDLQSAFLLLESIPFCGALFQGEIGQINGNSHLHAYSSCWGLLVKRNP